MSPLLKLTALFHVSKLEFWGLLLRGGKRFKKAEKRKGKEKGEKEKGKRSKGG